MENPPTIRVIIYVNKSGDGVQELEIPSVIVWALSVRPSAETASNGRVAPQGHPLCCVPIRND